MAEDLDQQTKERLSETEERLSNSQLLDADVQSVMGRVSKAVSIGGDLANSTVVTGDNNQINNQYTTINQGTDSGELLDEVNRIVAENQGANRKDLLDKLNRTIKELEDAQQRPVRCKTRSMLITSVGIGLLVGIVRFLAGLQGLELWALDGLMATQKLVSYQIDDRILVIAPNDEEVQAQGSEVNDRGVSFTDDKLAEVLEKVQKYHPVVIGLDLQRPFAAKGKLAQILSPNLVTQPIQPSVTQPSKAVVKRLSLKGKKRVAAISPPPPAKIPVKFEPLNLVGGCKAVETEIDTNGQSQTMKGTEVPPPIEIAKAHPDQIGFVDFVIGVGSRTVLRRQILAQSKPPHADTCKTTVAFSVRIASQLLFKENGYTKLDTSPEDKQCLKFIHSDPSKSFSFPYFNAVTGGFQGGAEANDRYGGCQMLLNYGIKNIRKINLTQLLKDNELDQDPKPKIIVIGSAAHTHSDLWLTPLGEQEGAVVQALTVSQIIDTVLGKQRLIWALPEWTDFLWVLSWSLLGGVLGWRLRFWKPWSLALSVAVVILYLGCGLSFWLLRLWLPLIPSLITVLASASSVAYLNFRRKFGTSNPFQILRAALIESK